MFSVWLRHHMQTIQAWACAEVYHTTSTTVPKCGSQRGLCLAKHLGRTAAPMRSTKPRDTCSSNGNALVSLSLCVFVSGPLFVCSFVSVCEGGARRSGYCCGCWAAVLCVCCVVCSRQKQVGLCHYTAGAWGMVQSSAVRQCFACVCAKVWLTPARGVQPQGASTKQVSARYLQRKHPWWYLLPRGSLTGRPPVKPCGEGGQRSNGVPGVCCWALFQRTLSLLLPPLGPCSCPPALWSLRVTCMGDAWRVWVSVKGAPLGANTLCPRRQEAAAAHLVTLPGGTSSVWCVRWCVRSVSGVKGPT